MSGAEVYSERSKGYWIDLIQATKLQGQAGNPGLMMASSNLIKSLVNIAKQLTGRPLPDYEQAESMLKEALMVIPSSLQTALLYQQRQWYLDLKRSKVCHSACSMLADDKTQAQLAAA